MRLQPWSLALTALAASVAAAAEKSPVRLFDLRPAVALAPVFDAATSVKPAGIEGVWAEPGNDPDVRQLKITADPAAPGSYRCAFSGLPLVFSGRFYQAGKSLLLELTAIPGDADEPFLLGTTYWWGVSLERSMLTLRPLSLDFGDALAEGRVQLAHVEAQRRWVVTAPPAAVRAVLSAPLPAGPGDNFVLTRR